MDFTLVLSAPVVTLQAATGLGTYKPGKSSYPQISQIIAAARIYWNIPERLSPCRRGIEASLPPQ